MTIPYRPRLPLASGTADEDARVTPRGIVPDATAPQGPPQSIITRQLPEEAAPSGAVFFSPADSAAVVGAGVVAALPNASVQVDQFSYGVLKGLDVFVTPWTNVSSVFFTVLIDGRAVRGFERIAFVPANLALVSRGFDMSLQIPQGSLVTVQATDVDGAAYTVGVELFGWMWPIAIDSRYRPEGVR
jgi:hypothetical protein